MSEVVFMYAGDGPKNSGNLSGLPQLFELLQSRDLNPAVSSHGEEAFQEAGVDLKRMDLSSWTIASEGFATYHQAKLLINRIGRTIDYAQLPDAARQLMVINENSTRDITNDKCGVYETVLRPLSLGIETTPLTSLQDTVAFIEANRTQTYIVKPKRGIRGKDVETVDEETLVALNSDYYKGTMLIQPKYNFTGSLPANMRPYDAASKNIFEDVGSSDASKELRVYGFLSPIGIDVFPVGRAIKDKEDEWFFVDPDSLSENIYESTKAVIQNTAHLTGARALLGALDFGYGNMCQEDDEDWHVIELNTKQPYMIGYNKHVGVAHQLRTLFADQIRASVDNT